MELDVEYHGETVGHLHQHSSGAIFFDYAAAWRSGRRELSPFHLPNSTPGAASTFKSHFGELHGNHGPLHLRRYGPRTALH